MKMKMEKMGIIFIIMVMPCLLVVLGRWWMTFATARESNRASSVVSLSAPPPSSRSSPPSSAACGTANQMWWMLLTLRCWVITMLLMCVCVLIKSDNTRWHRLYDCERGLYFIGAWEKWIHARGRKWDVVAHNQVVTISSVFGHSLRNCPSAMPTDKSISDRIRVQFDQEIEFEELKEESTCSICWDAIQAKVWTRLIFFVNLIDYQYIYIILFFLRIQQRLTAAIHSI